MLFQVEQLLIKKQTDEAISLFEVLSINLSKSDYEEVYKLIDYMSFQRLFLKVFVFVFKANFENKNKSRFHRIT